MSSPIVELVQFRLKPGVDEEAFLAAVADTHTIITHLPGFLSRELLKSSDGLWVDMVHWKSKAEALAAAAAFETLAEFAPFARMIDETHMRMQHLDHVRFVAQS